MVQHRALLGLWHRRAGAGPLLRRLPHRQGACLGQRLRAPAAARLLHPVGRRRSGQRRRHHGPLGARGAAVQIRLGHRVQFLQAARRWRKALGRRALLGADELSEDRRPRRRRDQIGRHDAARRQDGDRRRRPSRHRGFYRLEGHRGAEGGRARRRLEAGGRAPQPDHGGLPRRARRRRRPVRPGAEPGPEARDPRGAAGDDPGELRPAGHPVRPPGLRPDRFPHLRHRLGQRGLSDRRRAEFQQYGARHQRLPRARRIGRRLAAHPPHRRQGVEDPAGIRVVGQDRARRLGVGRSRHPVRYDDQRLAHLLGKRPDQRLEPVLGIHVPRRHGVQSRLAQPAGVPQRRRLLRGRRVPACGAAVDAGLGTLGDDGAVPGQGDRPAQLRLPHVGARLRQSRRLADGAGHRL